MLFLRVEMVTAVIGSDCDSRILERDVQPDEYLVKPPTIGDSFGAMPLHATVIESVWWIQSLQHKSFAQVYFPKCPQSHGLCVFDIMSLRLLSGETNHKITPELSRQLEEVTRVLVGGKEEANAGEVESVVFNEGEDDDELPESGEQDDDDDGEGQSGAHEQEDNAEDEAVDNSDGGNERQTHEDGMNADNKQADTAESSDDENAPSDPLGLDKSLSTESVRKPYP